MSTELANTETREIAQLNDLALQARALRMTIDMNMWELARVFCEAKELVPHGQFGRWVEENADCSERTAQSMMSAYKRFGGRPQFEGLGRAKTFKLLPLPEGAEDTFLEEHDLSAMSAREVERAVKQAREEAQAEIDRERKARLEAESRTREIPQDVQDELRRFRDSEAQYKAEIDCMKRMNDEQRQQRDRLEAENRALHCEIGEQTAMLQEQQEDIERAQQELLGMKSAIAKGDAERIPADQLTLDTFAGAVRGFIGTCARLPQMQCAFASMSSAEKDEYGVLLATVEKWVRDSRDAMRAIVIDTEVTRDA